MDEIPFTLTHTQAIYVSIGQQTFQEWISNPSPSFLSPDFQCEATNAKASGYPVQAAV